MSTGPSSNLGFLCPQCQKRLKAPPELIGKKVQCPGCKAKVLVPGVSASKKDDDDWFSLDTPSAVIGVDEIDNELPAPKPKPAAAPPGKSTPAPAVSPAPPAAPEPTVSTQPASSAERSEGSGSRSIFDEEVLDLEPLLPAESPAPTTAKWSQPSPQASPQKQPTASPAAPAAPRSKGASPSSAAPSAPPSKPASPKALPAKPPSTASMAPKPTDDDGFGLPEPIVLQEVPDQSARDEAALREFFQPADDENFTFPCKICGTLIYAMVSRVGKMTRCPDCHSEFSIPAKPKKKKAPELRLDDQVADVKLAPVEGPNIRENAMGTTKTKEMLDKAAVALETEREEIDPVTMNFDSRRWMRMIFGFLRDPGVLIVTIVLGILTGIWLYSIDTVSYSEMSPLKIGLTQMVIFGVFFIPITWSILMMMLAILPMAADQQPRVESWPFGRLFETFGEVMMIVVAAALASVPGGIVASALSSLIGVSFISGVLVLLSICAFTPILLLGMIDNGRITGAYSKAVIQSISLKQDAWAAMYFQTGGAFFLLAVLGGIARMTAPVAYLVFGAMIPFLCFFIANQYGLLAGRISDVTELGFEGDFTED